MVDGYYDVYRWDSKTHRPDWERYDGIRVGSLVRIKNTTASGEMWVHRGDCVVDNPHCPYVNGNDECECVQYCETVVLDEYYMVATIAYGFVGVDEHADEEMCTLEFELVGPKGRGWLYAVGIEVIRV